MLAIRHTQRGMSLIEIAVGLVLLAILIVSGAPSFSTWLQNSKIRTTAEAIQNGLQLARAEAVRRNALIRFQLTSTLDANCALSTAAANWIVSFDNPSDLCGNAYINEAFPISDAVNNPAPRIIQKRPAAEGSAGVTVAAGQSVIVFNGLGRVTPMVARVDIDISNTSGGATCVEAGGNMRCLRLQVTGGGQIRLCDPVLAGTDPQGCL